MPIVKVKHIKDYILKVEFSNKIIKKVDLREFMMNAQNPCITKYRDISKFKNVKIEDGSLSWGDGEFDFFYETLYNNSFASVKNEFTSTKEENLEKN